MPFGNGSGPGNQARGRGMGRGGRGGSGPGGECVCPSCNARVAHQAGVPCFTVKCPKCGIPMVRAFN